MKSKGFVPIIVLVLILIGIGGYFGYRRVRSISLQPTMSWKTYTASVHFNQRGTYSIMYPEKNMTVHFKPTQGIGEDTTEITSNNVKYNEHYEVIDGIHMYIAFIGQEGTQTQMAGPIEQIRIGNIMARKRQIENKVGTLIEYRIPLLNQQPGSQEYVQVIGYVAGPQSQSDIQLVNQILSTFKFTE